MSKLSKNLMAMALTIIMVLSSIAPATGSAVNVPLNSNGEIIAFEPLDDSETSPTTPLDKSVTSPTAPLDESVTSPTAPPDDFAATPPEPPDDFAATPPEPPDDFAAAPPTPPDNSATGINEDFVTNETDMQFGGSAGDNVNWSLDPGSGLLEIKGYGEMWNWGADGPAPWYGQSDLISSVYIYPGVTSIGDFAFAGLGNLMVVNYPDDISAIGADAYAGASKLLKINIYEAPAAFDFSASSAADPGLDRLLSGFNILSGAELRRMNTKELITAEGRKNLEQLNQSAGFMSYAPGNRAVYNYYAASSMEEFAQKQLIDLKTKWGSESSFGSDINAGINIGIIKIGGTFKSSASYRYDQSKFFSSNSSFKTAYESYYSVLEIRRELGKNYIVDPQSLRTQNSQIWAALSPGARDALLTGNIHDLFDRYGTHVLTSYNFGGRAEQFVGIIRTSAEPQTSIREEISKSHSGSGGVSVGGSVGVEGIASLGSNLSFNTSANWMRDTITAAERLRSNNTHDYTSTSIVFGGNMDLGKALDPKSTPADLNGWLNSMSADDAADTTELFVDHQLEMVGIWELLPPGYETRRAEIQRVFLDAFHDLDMNFYDDYIYNMANIVNDMEKPQFDNSFITVSTPEQLNAIRNNLSGKYILTNDIDLSGYANWTPIGTQASPFIGVIEGNGHTVRNINVASGSAAPGLFGYNGGTIKYLGAVYNSRYGGVAGADSGTISNCHVEYAHKAPNQTITITNSTTVMTTFTTVANSVVLVDFTGRTTLDLNNMTITVPNTVQTVIFRGVGQNFMSLNIAVQGNNTDIVFDNFNYGGSNNTSVTASALRLTGTNPAIILRGSSCSITGYGTYSNSAGNRAVVEASGSLYICGNANFNVTHINRYYIQMSMLTIKLNLPVGVPGSSGKAAIWAGSTLDIALNAKLTANGGDGFIGTAGGDGGDGANNYNSWNDGQPGYNGSMGSTGGPGGNGITANSVNILNNTNIVVSGGAGAVGGEGGAGGKGGNGGSTKPGSDLYGWGGAGGQGGSGGAGGNGGNGISANALSVYNGSEIYLYGGKGGDGNTGGTGGVGGVGSQGVLCGSRGGGGGYGGIGGRGGAGGAPLAVSPDNNLNQSALKYYLYLDTGRGGVGGGGGTGGAGGKCDNNVFSAQSYGGDGGRGGGGGAGGYHGLLDVIGGINGRLGYYYTASGGTAAYGGAGGSGKPAGTSYSSTRGTPNPGASTPVAASYLTHIRGSKPTVESNTTLWTTRLNRFVFGIDDPDNRKTAYYPGDVFDPTGFVFRDNNNTVIPHSSIDFKYDFSTFGATLVIATYYVGSITVIRYIPVYVVQPTVVSVELIKPERTQFWIGSNFDCEGIALEIAYSDDYIKRITDGLAVDAPADVTATTGTKTIPVSRPAFAGTVGHPGIAAFSGSYDISVENDMAVSLEVVNMPSVAQIEGNAFNPLGMSFRVRYLSGDTQIITTGVTYSHGLLEAPSQNFQITATYKNVSVTFTVEVRRDVITGLELRPSLNPNFFAGDVFDPQGYSISAVRNSERRTPLLWSDVEIYPNDALYASDNQITFRYYDVYGGNFINRIEPITVAAVRQTGISVTTPPDKVMYYEGELFDPAGMVVESVFNDVRRNMEIIASGYMIANANVPLRLGDLAMTVTSGGFTADIPITVVPKGVMELELISGPDKTTYKPGELFEPTGIVLRATYSNGDVENNITSGFLVSLDRTLVETDTEIMIIYGGVGLNEAIPIVVKENLPIEKPTADPGPGMVTLGTNIELSCGTADAAIRYTTDGSEPSSGSTLYTSPITIGSAVTIKAKAFKDGMIDSETAAFVYTIAGSISLSPVADRNFGLVNVGYTARAPHTVTINNTDPTRPTGALTIAALDGDGGPSADFTLSKTSVGGIDVGGHDSFTVAPIIGLPVGVYSAFVLVSGDGVAPQWITVNFAVTSETTPTISVSAVRGVPGETVVVEAILQNNPGLASLVLNIGYDRGALALESVSSVRKGPALADLAFTGVNSDTLGNNPFKVNWFASANDYSNGVLLSLTFLVSEAANDGLYSISIGVDGAWDQNDLVVPILALGANITVSNHIYGDANGDGVVTLLDAVRIAQWVNGWDVDLCEVCADANGDGEVTLLDAVRIAQWVNGWDVKLGP